MLIHTWIRLPTAPLQPCITAEIQAPTIHEKAFLLKPRNRFICFLKADIGRECFLKICGYPIIFNILLNSLCDVSP